MNDASEETHSPLPLLWKSPSTEELPETAPWQELAWRPAGSRSLAERWLRAGNPPPRPPDAPKVIRRKRR